MERAPQLADNEEILVLHHLLLEFLLEGHSQLLILVYLGAVNVVVPHINSNLHSLSQLTRRGLPGAKAQAGHLCALVEFQMASHDCCTLHTRTDKSASHFILTTISLQKVI